MHNHSCNTNRFDGAEEVIKYEETPSFDMNTDMYQNTRKNFRFLYLKKKPASYRAPTAAHLGTLSDVTAAEKKLRKIIDELSLQLREMVAERGFADDAVVALSQKLDIYIVQLQHLLRQKSNFCQ